ncbi:antitoxin MazE-like protein [Niveispirillum irakense]|uniref:antitoxin MazE-like protein n=1 Tax=Niveispirillum irakense TaxID=34011 RepID=UPI000401E53B|nr:antitoxin MazE-like protein [Niveispirillum irakense]
MGQAAERVKAFRERKRAQGLREIRLFIPDARSPQLRARIAEQVAQLDPVAEADAMDWIESVSDFDNEDLTDATR